MHQRFKIGVRCAVAVAIGVLILQRSLLEETRCQLVLMARERINEGTAAGNRSASVSNTPIDLHSIVAKWKLVSPQAVSLLQQIADKPFDYDPSKDLLIFEHPFKTGGTSVSNVLKEMGGVIPGSHDSGYFAMRLFMETQEKELHEFNMTLEDWWREKKVLYSHSFFRKGRGESSHTRILRSYLPQSRQLRILTMTRDPVAWTASSHSMSGCGYSRTLAHYVQALRLQAFGLNKGNISSSSSIDPCYGLSPSNLTDLKIKYDFGPKCRDKYETVKRSKRAVCDAYLANETDLFPQCRSISNFLHSSGYMENAHNRQVNRVNTGINGTEADFENGALEHFGGLEQGENAPIPVMWVGITERMPESMCLLHYSLRLPYVETPRDRVMTCRPESRWTDSEKAIVREREILDYAVHRVANAILDVRLAKMRQELDQNASLLSMPYVGPRCLQFGV